MRCIYIYIYTLIGIFFVRNARPLREPQRIVFRTYFLPVEDSLCINILSTPWLGLLSCSGQSLWAFKNAPQALLQHSAADAVSRLFQDPFPMNFISFNCFYVVPEFIIFICGGCL